MKTPVCIYNDTSLKLWKVSDTFVEKIKTHNLC